MARNMNDEGYLELILGPMFSGKTSKLIEIYNQCTYCDIKVLVLNHSIDDRYSDNTLCTHDKKEIPCLKIHNLNNIRDLDEFKECKVILLNEGQFFENLYNNVLHWVDVCKKHVYVCGLDGDYKRNTFGQILHLIPLCNKVYKLNSLCSNCKNGTHALFSHRISSDEDQISIGSLNYQPLCRKCYLNVNL
jgi:thymidine kinase